MKKFLSNLWGGVIAALSSPRLQNAIVSYLEKNAVKMVLKKLLISGGLKGWIISFVVTELVEEADEHLIEPAFRAIGFYSDTLEGAKVYKKVLNAEDVNEWVDTLGDV